MRPVNSMIEFKQIIGRGTRLFDGKDYFTIYDFVKAYEHFNDPEWDGEPIEPVQPRPKPKGEEQEPEPQESEGEGEGEPKEKRQRIKIKLADGKERTIQHMSATTFWSPDGKPMSAAEFIARLFGDLPEMFKTEDDLRRIWSRPDTRKALLEGLAEKGYGSDELGEIRKMIDAEKSDLFDVLAYIAFALAPITREERVVTRRAGIFARYDGELQQFLDFVLSQYVKEGFEELDQDKLGKLLELKYHSINDAVAALGGAPQIAQAFIGFQQYLYEQQA
jgi:type I restriction enzyme R subunit